MCKCNSSWRSLRETPATSNSGYKALGIPAQCPSAPIRSRTPQQCCLCSAHWVSEHNNSASGNPSQQVISSRQPVIYSKCLNELKRVSSGLTFLVLADRSLHCFLLFNKICLCHRGLQIFLTFVLFTWKQQNNEFEAAEMGWIYGMDNWESGSCE